MRGAGAVAGDADPPEAAAGDGDATAVEHVDATEVADEHVAGGGGKLPKAAPRPIRTGMAGSSGLPPGRRVCSSSALNKAAPRPPRPAI